MTFQSFKAALNGVGKKANRLSLCEVVIAGLSGVIEFIGGCRI